MLEQNPFAQGLRAFAAAVRRGELSFAATTQYCIDRIERLNPKLNCFQHVDPERAVATATALDQLLSNGTDLGPLMGVPIGVKDIITVDGMPVTNGSLHPTADLNGSEGRVIKKFRSLGCVVLGKTKTVEFALGATGVNEARGTPWNPWDLTTHRIPGGSSSGSGVATAAGLCAFALGSDTGGSIRIPACYNGLFGHKTSMGLWPTDGVFPLSPTLDSIGPLCNSAADAALVHECFTGAPPVGITPLNGLRFAKPSPVFFEELDTEVQQCFNAAIQQLQSHGVEFIEIELPQSQERNEVFPKIVGAELISTLTSSGYEQAAPKMDTVTSARAAVGLKLSAEEYLAAVKRHRQLIQIAHDTFTGTDAWVSPTVPMLAMSVEDLNIPELAQRALLSSRNTQLGNLYGLCAATLPMHQLVPGTPMPTGFQLMLPAGADTRLLATAKSIENALGQGPRARIDQR